MIKLTSTPLKKNGISSIQQINWSHKRHSEKKNFLQIWSNLSKKSLMENLIFCAVHVLGFGSL